MAILGAAGAFAKATAAGAFTKATSAGAFARGAYGHAGRAMGFRTPTQSRELYRHNDFSLDSDRVLKYGLIGGGFIGYKSGDNTRKRRGRAS